MCKTNECKSWMCCHKTSKAIGLLGLRLALAAIFIMFGSQKLGANHAGASMMMEKIGMPGSGSMWAYLVGGLEVLGGLMLALGAYAPIAAGWLIIIMVVALLTAHKPGSPFSSYALELSVLGGLMGIAGAGAGRWRAIKNQCCCKTCKMDSAMGSGCGGNCACGPKTMPNSEMKK